MGWVIAGLAIYILLERGARRSVEEEAYEDARERFLVELSTRYDFCTDRFRRHANS